MNKLHEISAKLGDRGQDMDLTDQQAVVDALMKAEQDLNAESGQ